MYKKVSYGVAYGVALLSAFSTAMFGAMLSMMYDIGCGVVDAEAAVVLGIIGTIAAVFAVAIVEIEAV